MTHLDHRILWQAARDGAALLALILTAWAVVIAIAAATGTL